MEIVFYTPLQNSTTFESSLPIGKFCKIHRSIIMKFILFYFIYLNQSNYIVTLKK